MVLQRGAGGVRNKRLGAKSPTGGKGEGEGELHHRFMSPAQNDFPTGQKNIR